MLIEQKLRNFRQNESEKTVSGASNKVLITDSPCDGVSHVFSVGKKAETSTKLTHSREEGPFW